MAEYHVENFGCRASQADGAAISAGLDQSGLTPSVSYRTADVLILNTCSVTEEADRQARAFVRKARRANPGIKVVVTGCYAQRAPQEVAALPGVDRVVGNSHKSRVAAVASELTGTVSARQPGMVPLSELLRSGQPLVDDDFAHADLAFLPSSGEEPGQHRTRPNLKVQDGCGNRCSFCVIPQTRGGSRSVPLATVLASVHAFTENGGQEMVLSGINLGRWGRDLPVPLRFEDMVEAILVETGLPRLRISSVEPMDWPEGLIDLFRTFAHGRHPRLARHAHLPLQSGSDAILRAMFRRYRPWHYAAKVETLRQAMPGAAIGADVMVGFPGETDALFEETYAFIQQHPFTYLHLFPFSARPGTPAWGLHKEKPVAHEAVRERMERLRAIIAAKHQAFAASFIGQALSVVTLQGDASGVQVSRAISDNFLTVALDVHLPANRMVRARMEHRSTTGAAAGELQGRAIGDAAA